VKSILKYAPYFFGFLFMVILLIALQVLIRSPFFRENIGEDYIEKKYHYAFFLPSADYSFFRQLKEGALNASESMDCAITFYELDSNSRSLAMVPFSGYDGIGIFPYRRDESTLTALGKISQAGIPVVQIENEVFRDETSFFIGTNNFETGKAVATLARKSEKTTINMALVYSQKNPGMMTKSNLIEMGLISNLGDRLGDLEILKTSLNPLDAEQLTYDLLLKKPSTDIIVLTDPNDTLVAVQAIVDLNLVGTVQIIGFGQDKRIQEYIHKGLVLGTIVRNPFRIGFSTVMALNELSANGYTSAYVDTGISIVDETREGARR